MSAVTSAPARVVTVNVPNSPAAVGGASRSGLPSSSRDLLDGLGQRLREAEDQVLAGLDEAQDRQAFRTLLQRLALHAATALDSATPDPCAPAC